MKINIKKWFLFILLFSNNLSANNNDVEILYFGTKEDTAFIGVGQGLEDGSSQYDNINFRIKIEMENFRPYTDPAPEAIFVSADSESIRLLSILNPETPVFNLIDDTLLIREMCLDNVFHIIPGQDMRDDATKHWQASYPEANIEAVAWHSDFNIGDASKLNQKFMQKRNMTLTEQGWSGWIAAKIFVESLAAEPNRKGVKLINYLKNNTKINAYKGVPVSFRKDGQLRQSLLIIEDDILKGEIPKNNVDGDERLDEFGLLHCS